MREPPAESGRLKGGCASKVSNHDQGSTSQATTTKVRRLQRSTAPKWNTCMEGLAKYSSPGLEIRNSDKDVIKPR